MGLHGIFHCFLDSDSRLRMNVLQIPCTELLTLLMSFPSSKCIAGVTGDSSRRSLLRGQSMLVEKREENNMNTNMK